MKKLLLAVPLVVGASWAGASYYTGTQTQGAYDHLLEQLNELKPFTLVNESYNTGFTKSVAVTRVMDSAAPDASVLFRLQHEIDHSPVGVNEGNVRVGAATIRTTLVRDDYVSESATEFMRGFVDSEPFIIDTDVSFDGNTDTRLQVSPYRGQQAEMDFSFGGVDYSVSSAGDVISGSGTLGEFLIQANGGEVRLAPGAITTDLTRISQAIYSGSYGIDFGSLSILSEENMAMHATLRSIGLHSDTQINGDLMNSSLTLSVGQIDSLLPLNSISMQTGMSNVSVQGLKSYVDTVSQLSAMDVMGSDDPEIMKTILAAYVPMIGPGTGLDVNVTLNNDGGDASLDYGLSVVEESRAAYPAGGIASIKTLRDLFNVLVLEAHFSADAAVIDQSPLAMFLMRPEAQQFIVSDGVSYKADMTLSELIMDINGNPMAFEMMLGDKLDMPLADIMSL